MVPFHKALFSLPCPLGYSYETRLLTSLPTHPSAIFIYMMIRTLTSKYTHTPLNLLDPIQVFGPFLQTNHSAVYHGKCLMLLLLLLLSLRCNFVENASIETLLMPFFFMWPSSGHSRTYVVSPRKFSSQPSKSSQHQAITRQQTHTPKRIHTNQRNPKQASAPSSN
jgi:hypothetical protein